MYNSDGPPPSFSYTTCLSQIFSNIVFGDKLMSDKSTKG
jgi:hypothetical protein